MKKFLVLSLLFILFVDANMAPEGFERFPNYYFVETGTYRREGILLALRAGFPEIHSVEIDAHFVKEAKKRFINQSNVYIHEGDSGLVLWDVIKDLDKPITFWLDGHNGFPDPNSSAKNCPLMEELDQIKQHHIKTHTIIINDMHCCETLLFDFLTQEQIMQKILEINPNYVIEFVPGGGIGEYPVNIMVARVK